MTTSVFNKKETTKPSSRNSHKLAVVAAGVAYAMLATGSLFSLGTSLVLSVTLGLGAWTTAFLTRNTLRRTRKEFGDILLIFSTLLTLLAVFAIIMTGLLAGADYVAP
jgi:nitrogen fixation/metabolism regulation signal transduction histidine kinase